MGPALQTNAEVTIDRPAESVWAVVADYDSDRRWRKGIVEMTPDRPGAPRVGTHVREVLRLAGRSYTTDTIVTEAGPGMSYSFAGTGTSGAVRGRRSVRPRADGAVFSYEVELEPQALPRPVAPVLAWWLRRSLRRDVRRLRKLVEASA
ncbi:MAG TPA: SRPBCC family protein [Solirubrobacteraceae bacterium]|nr:SRPBCC family protein [Solirubrobacteraceae bacterium]